MLAGSCLCNLRRGLKVTFFIIDFMFCPKKSFISDVLLFRDNNKTLFLRHFTGLLIGPDTLLVWYFLDKNKLFDHSRSRLNKIPKFSLNSFPKYWYFDFYQIECYASPSKWLISLTMQWFCDKTKVTRFNERRHSFCCLDFQFRSAHIQFRAEHGLDNISVCIFFLQLWD